MNPDQIVLGVLMYVALVLALSVHECAHAAAALWLGDETALSQGRLTFNPLAHADPIGTVLFPLLGIFGGMHFLFGWAKPVPVQAANFRRGWFARGQVLTAAAGPASNLIQALAWTGVYVLATNLLPPLTEREGPVYLFAMFVRASVQINLILAAFNMLPIPPLDGAWVASWGLPRRLGERFDAVMQPNGFFILIVLMLTGVLRFVFIPVNAVGRMLLGLGAW